MPLKYTLPFFMLGVLSSPLAAAIEMAGVDFQGSGFLTLAAGTILNHAAAQPFGSYHCPCFLSDLAQGGVYQQGGVQWQPDTKLGLQGSAVFSPRFSVTGQIVARGAAGGQLDFEWLYADWKLNDKLTVQVGRKRLPLLYHSESQDVGMMYPWVHLAQQVYGWEIVNYNGLNVLYKDDWGDWSSAMNFFSGEEKVKNSRFWQMYNGLNTRTDSRWSNIIGLDLSLSKDWFDGRVAYIQSDIQNTDLFAADPLAFGVKTPQHIYSASLNADNQQWVVRTEFMYIDRRASYGEDFSQSYSLGYHLGHWLPMISFHNYYQALLAPDALLSEAHSTTSILLRYDISPVSAVKLQFDRWQNKADPAFFTANPNAVTPLGHVDLLTVSYDQVF
ncbi:MAG: hypothetical protein PHI11_08455 [Gallionella sp.]|nr:hypothetical protein [Gallionella sp.]